LGCGVVFKLSPSNQLTVLHTFTPPDQWPNAGLIRDAAGNLYGTTAGDGGRTFGTIFKLDANGKETLLHKFTTQDMKDGIVPEAGLIQDAASNLYGTTAAGGGFNNMCQGGPDPGLVFKVSKAGTETAVYRFKGPPDGCMPTAALLRDKAGNLYGVTEFGGDLNGACGNYGSGCGVIFKVNRFGKESLLYTFDGSVGTQPITLIWDGAGGFYGTTPGDGNFSFGTIFHFSSGGAVNTLHDFTNGSDGDLPRGRLVRDRAGNWYGTTEYGGDPVCNCGVVFEITP
jgi:uncharacterized repeat protein (TIGR03803 family)